MSAHRKDLWPYYALVATAGAVIAGNVTYRLARKAGHEALEKKIRPLTALTLARLARYLILGFLAA